VPIAIGAAAGTGRQTALLFAREGAQIGVTDLNKDDAQKLIADIEREYVEARFVRMDVSEVELCRR
jgi:NAD(P)-dependent dehydrogenase (short-subunit alcohol dehydrogenase family)